MQKRPKGRDACAWTDHNDGGIRLTTGFFRCRSQKTAVTGARFLVPLRLQGLTVD